MSGIYRIVSPSGRVYVGQTRQSFGERFRHYRALHCERQHKLHSSLLKYGVAAHAFEILEDFSDRSAIYPATIDAFEEAIYLEYVAAGFRMLNVRRPGLYPKHSLETITRIRAKALGRKPPIETVLKREATKRRNGTTGKGVPKSESTRRKISESLKGRITPPEVIIKREETMRRLHRREARRGMKFKRHCTQ